MTTSIPVPFETQHEFRDDQPHIGDWYWVLYDDEEWDETLEKNVKTGTREDLMCVMELGSNYVGFEGYNNKYSNGDRIHLNEFLARCRIEPNWKQVFQLRMQEYQQQIAAKTIKMIERAKDLCLIKEAAVAVTDDGSLLPVLSSSVDLRKHQKQLVKYQKGVPELSKEIDELAEQFGAAARNMMLPDLAKLRAVKSTIGVVEDRIFSIELYVGLKEDVCQIADGQPAPFETPISVRQLMLFMDEETLFDYESGGMDYEKVEDFDKWITQPANLNRCLPEQKGIVAFRIRRSKKDYGTPSNLLECWTQFHKDMYNMQTYLLIRNGEKVYRVASDVDFTPRLIPNADELSKEPFEESHTDYSEKDDKGQYKEHTKVFTPADVHYDDHVATAMKRIKHYNRVIILLQGLLDRTDVFNPHPMIRLQKQNDMEKWVTLIRDEEKCLPALKITLEKYLKQLNSTLRAGKWIYILPQYRHAEKEKYSDKYWPVLHGKSIELKRPHRGYNHEPLPAVIKIESMPRDKSSVYVSWPQGELSNGKKEWVNSKDRPGWGHYHYNTSTDRMLHESIPVAFVMNLSDYTLGDYKMFLCDRSLKGEFLEWAPPLLTAEDFQRKQPIKRYITRK